jgi:hypothetical protein
MTVERFIPIVIVIGVALLLVLLGVVLALRQQRKASQPHASATADKSAPDWMKSMAGSTGKALTRGASVNIPTEAILVMRDPTSSEWVVEVNGMRYNALKDIHDDKAASKVLEALSGLQRFAGTIPIVSRDLKGQGVIPTAPAVSTAAAVPLVEPAVAQALSSGSATPSQPMYPAPANSVLDQIEKILQHNLMRYPEFAERKIHVGVAADGSLLIEVDRQFYHHADEVPDLTIRGVIKSSIQEWERAA